MDAPALLPGLILQHLPSGRHKARLVRLASQLSLSYRCLQEQLQETSQPASGHPALPCQKRSDLYAALLSPALLTATAQSSALSLSHPGAIAVPTHSPTSDTALQRRTRPDNFQVHPQCPFQGMRPKNREQPVAMEETSPKDHHLLQLPSHL